MKIDLTKLKFVFSQKPLLIGGKAMEYYGLRKSGTDTDFVVTAEDYLRLAELYPKNKKDLFGDLGVTVKGFEIWRSICLYTYDFLSRDAIPKGKYIIISIEMLLFLKVLGHHLPKYKSDVDLLVKKIFAAKYPKKLLRKFYKNYSDKH